MMFLASLSVILISFKFLIPKHHQSFNPSMLDGNEILSTLQLKKALLSIVFKSDSKLYYYLKKKKKGKNIQKNKEKKNICSILLIFLKTRTSLDKVYLSV